MHKKIKRRIPNFDLGGWVKQRGDKLFYIVQDPATKTSKAVGVYEIFIHKQTNNFGYRILALDEKKIICLTWIKKINDGGKLKGLIYTAYWSGGQWQMRRVKDIMLPACFKKDDKGVIVGITISLPLITGKEENFFVKINP